MPFIRYNLSYKSYHINQLEHNWKENTKAGDDGVYSTHKNSSEIGKLQIGLLDEPIRKMNDNTFMIKFVI